MSSLQTFQQLQRVARDRKRPVDEIITLYGLERFLARLGRTIYAEEVCLKGGVLLSAHALRRPTRDIDLRALDFAVDVEHLTDVVSAVASVIADDHLVLDTPALRVEQIRDDGADTGLRLAIPAAIHRAKIVVKVDVSTGDPIWPDPEPIEIPGLLGRTVGMIDGPPVGHGGSSPLLWCCPATCSTGSMECSSRLGL